VYRARLGKLLSKSETRKGGSELGGLTNTLRLRKTFRPGGPQTYSTSTVNLKGLGRIKGPKEAKRKFKLNDSGNKGLENEKKRRCK